MYILVCLGVFIFESCSSKKDILYFQGVKQDQTFTNTYLNSKIQINDILDITVNSKMAASALPFNKDITNNTLNMNLDVLKLKGYLVDSNGYITFPVLGKIYVIDKSNFELESYLQDQLITGEHIMDASVVVRVINSKVTILGEVNKPGTFSFTEENLTLLQAIGLAGDLTINGTRNDILLIRMNGDVKTITNIDLTKTNWLNSSDFFVKSNDVIIVNPNSSKVRSAGYFGNPGTILTIASLVLSSIILITR